MGQTSGNASCYCGRQLYYGQTSTMLQLNTSCVMSLAFCSAIATRLCELLFYIVGFLVARFLCIFTKCNEFIWLLGYNIFSVTGFFLTV